MPFLLLVCGLLGGAVVSAVVISTTLESGSFKITQLQQQESQLVRTQQQLAEQVATEKSPRVIYNGAYQLGMRPQGMIRFVNVQDGTVETDAAGTGAGNGGVNAVNVPGFTP
jgi:hypothetical protein